MEIDQALRFIAANHNAVLSTTRQDGKAQLSPVTVGTDAEDRVIVSSRETAMKTKNLRRVPYGALCVFSAAFYGEWVQIEGGVELVTLPEAMDGLIDYYRLISGEHPDWDDYRAAMERERRVLLRMTPTRAGPDRSG